MTEPGRFVACSLYFVTRWMPLLGGDGTRIVLALRSLGYYNPRTGERRDQIVVGHAELAARVGCSEDTLSRQLGTDRETGKPRNPVLARFVERERRVRRDPHTGRVWQEENAYRVAMDDPIHPDDWGKVAGAVAEREAQKAEAGAKAPIPSVPQPGTNRTAPATRPRPPIPQIAVSERTPGPQPAVPAPQAADSTPCPADSGPQSAAPLKGKNLYSPLPKKNQKTAGRDDSLSGIEVKDADEAQKGRTPNKKYQNKKYQNKKYQTGGKDFVDKKDPVGGNPVDAGNGVHGAPCPLPGQSGYAAFKEVVSQLRAREAKAWVRPRKPVQKAEPSERTGTAESETDSRSGGSQ